MGYMCGSALNSELDVTISYRVIAENSTVEYGGCGSCRCYILCLHIVQLCDITALLCETASFLRPVSLKIRVLCVCCEKKMSIVRR